MSTVARMLILSTHSTLAHMHTHTHTYTHTMQAVEASSKQVEVTCKRTLAGMRTSLTAVVMVSCILQRHARGATVHVSNIEPRRTVDGEIINAHAGGIYRFGQNSPKLAAPRTFKPFLTEIYTPSSRFFLSSICVNMFHFFFYPSLLSASYASSQCCLHAHALRESEKCTIAGFVSSWDIDITHAAIPFASFFFFPFQLTVVTAKQRMRTHHAHLPPSTNAHVAKILKIFKINPERNNYSYIRSFTVYEYIKQWKITDIKSHGIPLVYLV